MCSISGKSGKQKSMTISFPWCHHDICNDHGHVSSIENHENGTLIAIVFLIGLASMFGMVSMALAVMSSWLAIRFPAIMLITRAATTIRAMTIGCIAISVIISRGFVMIVGVSEVMTRAGTPCNAIAFGLAVVTEVFCSTVSV